MSTIRKKQCGMANQNVAIADSLSSPHEPMRGFPVSPSIPEWLAVASMGFRAPPSTGHRVRLQVKPATFPSGLDSATQRV